MGFKITMVAFWEIEREAVRLGSLCVFISNLQSYAKLKGLCVGKFALIGSNSEISNLTGIKNLKKDLLLRQDLEGHWLEILFDALELDCICTYESAEDFFSKHQQQTLFPNPEICEAANITGNLYDTTQITSLLHKESGEMPSLDFKQNNSYVTSLENKFTVSLHLKNASKGDVESNANFPVWKDFIHSNDIQFLLIGSDIVPEDIKCLPNVTSLQDEGLSILEQLTCIQQSSAFMGMASGPANVAILSKIPYAIFKHPLHHADIMQKEIGDADHYDFAEQNQNILRKHETSELLSLFLSAVYK